MSASPSSPPILPAYLLSAALILAMLSPALRRPPVDGFPLSTYPMFSTPRGPSSKVHTLLGVTPTGEREVLSPRLISGDPWAILAFETTTKAARDRSGRERLCASAAARVAADPDRSSRYVELEFVTEVYEVRTYFVEDQTEPEQRRVLARCPVIQ